MISPGELREDMKVGKYVPLFVVVLDAEDVNFCKHASKLKHGEEKKWTRERDWEGGYLTEFAMCQHLRKLGKKYAGGRVYFGDGSEAPKDIILWRQGEQFTVGVRSRRHRDLERYPDSPICFYPKRRLSSQEKIADYVVMTSVKSNDDGSSSIAFWGAISKERLLQLLRGLPTQYYMSAGSLQDAIDIPLEEFNPRLLQDLLSSCDDKA